jgi:hypothetical protein
MGSVHGVITFTAGNLSGSKYAQRSGWGEIAFVTIDESGNHSIKLGFLPLDGFFQLRSRLFKDDPDSSSPYAYRLPLMPRSSVSKTILFESRERH